MLCCRQSVSQVNRIRQTGIVVHTTTLSENRRSGTLNVSHEAVLIYRQTDPYVSIPRSCEGSVPTLIRRCGTTFLFFSPFLSTVPTGRGIFATDAAAVHCCCRFFFASCQHAPPPLVLLIYVPGTVQVATLAVGYPGYYVNAYQVQQ